jgi:hypothetical protein
MEKSIFNKFYNAHYEDSKSDEAITRLLNRHKTTLLDKLNEEEKDIFNKFIELCDEEQFHSSVESFKQGFRACITLMLEVMQ